MKLPYINRDPSERGWGIRLCGDYNVIRFLFWRGLRRWADRRVTAAWTDCTSDVYGLGE